MQQTKKFFNDETAGLPHMDRQQIWGEILERIIDWEMLLRVYPVDKSRIPDDRTAAKELKEIQRQQGQE